MRGELAERAFRLTSRGRWHLAFDWSISSKGLVCVCQCRILCPDMHESVCVCVDACLWRRMCTLAGNMVLRASLPHVALQLHTRKHARANAQATRANTQTQMPGHARPALCPGHVVLKRQQTVGLPNSRKAWCSPRGASVTKEHRAMPAKYKGTGHGPKGDQAKGRAG